MRLSDDLSRYGFDDDDNDDCGEPIDGLQE